jgi:hypothetical protein
VLAPDQRGELLAVQRFETAFGTTLCPYCEHALIGQQEHEAWDVLLACQGQLRLSPSRHVIGIEVDTALSLASARGYDLAVLSKLVPAAEAGLIEAFSTPGGQDVVLIRPENVA